MATTQAQYSARYPSTLENARLRQVGLQHATRESLYRGPARLGTPAQCRALEEVVAPGCTLWRWLERRRDAGSDESILR